MRIRSIRPEFWSSEDVAAMDWNTRLVFIGLWSYVDDNGVGRDVEPLIVAALFPLDGDLPESSRRVTGALRHLSDHGQITRFRVDGKPYLFINAWKKHQRIEKASAGRYPLPTSENAEIAEPSPTTPGALLEPSTPGEGEKGRRGEALSSDESDMTDDLFDEFWTHYPRKDAKADARKAWKQITKRTNPQAIIDGLTAYAFGTDRQFIPMPASWLRGQRWEDEGASIHQLPSANGPRRMQVLVGPDHWRDVSGDEFVPIGSKTRWVSA